MLLKCQVICQSIRQGPLPSPLVMWLADNPLGHQLCLNTGLLDCLCPMVTSLRFCSRPRFPLDEQFDADFYIDACPLLQHLSQLSNLQSVAFYCNRDACDTTSLPDSWTGLAHLRKLSVEVTASPADDVGLMHVPALPCLTELCVASISVDLQLFPQLEALQWSGFFANCRLHDLVALTALTRLSLSQCRLDGDEEDLAELAGLTRLQHLQCHDLRGDGHKQDKVYRALWSVALTLESLTCLELDPEYSGVLTRGDGHLEQLCDLHQLCTLVLRRMDMPAYLRSQCCLPSSLTALQSLILQSVFSSGFVFSQSLSSLTRLVLADNQLIWYELGDLRHLTNLQCLSLDSNCLTYLPASLSHLTALTCLSLEDQNVDCFKLDKDLPLQSWPKLQYLLLRQRPTVWRQASLDIFQRDPERGRGQGRYSQPWDTHSLQVISRAVGLIESCFLNLTLLTDKDDRRIVFIKPFGVTIRAW